jgi:hypothetical protein
MSNDTEGGPPPIDHIVMPPAPAGEAHDVVPRSIETELEAAVRALVEREMALVPGCNRTTATVRITKRLESLRKIL